jgi:hypothetical protein
MMHERGKSDSAVGALKPANKAERSAAELVEQTAGTKGNAVDRHGSYPGDKRAAHIAFYGSNVKRLLSTTYH